MIKMPERPRKRKAKEPKVKIQSMVTLETYQLLEQRALREKRSISAVIALAVGAYLEGDQRSLPL
jgi:hypothetical protein